MLSPVSESVDFVPIAGVLKMLKALNFGGEPNTWFLASLLRDLATVSGTSSNAFLLTVASLILSISWLAAVSKIVSSPTVRFLHSSSDTSFLALSRSSAVLKKSGLSVETISGSTFIRLLSLFVCVLVASFISTVC